MPEIRCSDKDRWLVENVLGWHIEELSNTINAPHLGESKHTAFFWVDDDGDVKKIPVNFFKPMSDLDHLWLLLDENGEDYEIKCRDGIYKVVVNFRKDGEVIEGRSEGEELTNTVLGAFKHALVFEEKER